MDNREPTPTDIAAALARAKELVQRRNVDVIAALAEATMTAQCQGIQGFKVYRDTRVAVESVLDKKVSLPKFCETASREQSVKALDDAILVVKS